MGTYRCRARARAFSFTLTFEDFLRISQRPCYLCGQAPAQVKKGPRRNGQYIYNGIDRIDNKGGYTLDNVAPCCKTCNFLKGELSLDEFTRAIRKIAKELWGQDACG